MTLVAINSFVRRQTFESPFTFFNGRDEELIKMTEEAILSGNIIPGYRDGVVLAKVDPKQFYTGVVELKAGDRLVGEFSARREGETPRQHVYVNYGGVDVNPKTSALTVHVVCYRHDVLVEGGDAQTDAEWEIIALNGYAFFTDKDVPMQPHTMMHNHFGSDGGTKTGWTPEEFEKKLRESFLYWNDKGRMAPKNFERK